MKASTRFITIGFGAVCGWAVGRALIGNAAGVVTAVLADFESRRTEIPASSTPHRTVRTPSSKLPPRLRTDIELARSTAARKTVHLDEMHVSS